MQISLSGSVVRIWLHDRYSIPLFIIVRKGVSVPPFIFHPPFLISSLSLETCNPPTPLPFPLDTQHGKKLWYMIQILWYSRVRETKNNIKPWKPIAYRKCVSTECVLIDILVTIRIAVGAGCNFPHGKVGTKFHHIKIYNRLTIS